LERREPLGDELRTTVCAPRPLRAGGHRLARDLVVVGLVGLAEVRRIRVRDRAALAHPAERGARIEAARERDADLLADRKALEDVAQRNGSVWGSGRSDIRTIRDTVLGRPLGREAAFPMTVLTQRQPTPTTDLLTAPMEICWQFDYAIDVEKLRNLYAKAKEQQWTAESQRETFTAHVAAHLLSQFLHGEQGALMTAAALTHAVPDYEAKLYAATQTMDEARHVEVYQRYIDKIAL